MLQIIDSFSVLSRMGFRLLLGDSKYQWSRAAVLVATGGFCGMKALKLCFVLVQFWDAVLRRLVEEHVGHPLDDAEFERERQRLREEDLRQEQLIR